MISLGRKVFLKILILGQEVVRPPLNLPLKKASDEQGFRSLMALQ